MRGWRRTRAWGVAGTAALALASAAAPASADVIVDVAFPALDVHVSPASLTNGHRFSMQAFLDVSRRGVRFQQLGFGDPTIRSPANAFCITNGLANDVVCDEGLGINAAPITIRMAGGADTVQFLAGVGAPVGFTFGGPCIAGTHARTPVTVTLGAGDDTLTAPAAASCGANAVAFDGSDIDELNPVLDVDGGSGRDTIRGGFFGDDLTGGPNGDDVDGGPGDDTIDGGSGTDRLHGGPGADTFVGSGGSDTFDGGDGEDTVTYAGATAPVRATIGDSTDSDGIAGVSDDDVLGNVEDVTGGAAGDVLVGSDGPNTLSGGDGGDDIDGGPGPDRVIAGAGGDAIDIRDGERDPSVDCGPDADLVAADLQDLPLDRRLPRTAFTACESVRAFATDDGPPGHVGSAVLRLRHGAAAVRIDCPRGARVACRGSVTLLAGAGRRARVLARARYSVPVGRSAVAELALRAGRLRGARRVVARTVEKGVSRKGPRYATTQLRVA